MVQTRGVTVYFKYYSLVNSSSYFVFQHQQTSPDPILILAKNFIANFLNSLQDHQIE
jgi:hypothetical protein